MRIKDMITTIEIDIIFQQILPISTMRKCMDTG